MLEYPRFHPWPTALAQIYQWHIWPICWRLNSCNKYSIIHTLHLTQWASTWMVSLNPSKTVYMIISNKTHSSNSNLYMNNIRLKHITSESYFGMLFSNSMSWKNHIQKLTVQNSQVKLEFSITWEVVSHGLFCQDTALGLLNQWWSLAVSALTIAQIVISTV